MKLKTIGIIVLSFLFVQTSDAQKILTTNLGHTKKVNCVAYSPDGKHIVSGSDDNTVKLWDNNGHEIRTFKGHTNRVTDVSFSPDGNYILSCSNDTVKLWNCENGEIVRVFISLRENNCAAFSFDGNYIVTNGGLNGRIMTLWETHSGKEIRTFEGNGTEVVFCLAFSPDGKYIATGVGHKVILWDSQKGEEIKSLYYDQHNRPRNVLFSPDGKYIVSDFGRYIKIFNLAKKEEVISISVSNYIKNMAISPCSKYIVSCQNNTIKRWNIENGKEIESLVGKSKINTRGVNSVAYSPDGNFIISGDNNASIKLWDVQDSEDIKIFKGHNDNVTNIAFSSNGEYLVSANGIELKLYNTQKGKQIRTLNIIDDYIFSIAFSPDNKYLVSGSNGIIQFWDCQNGNKIKNIKGHTRPVVDLAFSPNGDRIVSSSYDNTIKIWNSENGEEITMLNIEWRAETGALFSKDGKSIISGGGSYHTIKLWNAQSGTLTKTFNGKHSWYIIDLAFSSNEKYIISASEDRSIKLWDYKSGEEIKTFNEYINKFEKTKIILTNDNKYFIYTNNKVVKCINIQNGEIVTTFIGHTDFVNDIAFFPNEKYIVSGSEDGTIKIWKTSTGKLSATLISIENTDDYVIYTPDGRFDGTEKGMELLYYVEGMDVIPLSSLYEHYYTPNLLARVLAGEEFEDPEIKIDDIKRPPLVEITSPNKQGDLRGFTLINAGELKTINKEIQVIIKVTDQGGGIDEIRLYLNDKLVETTQRGFIKVEQNNNVKTKTFTISLTNSENKIKATAFSKQRTESIPDEIIVFYEGVKKATNLHMLVIGIDNYKNPKYKLNYAVADATAFKKEVKEGSKDIFSSVNITFITDANATRERILQEFENIKTNVAQEDVFIFYYAGHGVMSVDDKPEFYIVPYEVTKLYEDNQTLRTTAISSDELLTFSTELKAQKQMFIFDACQSGGINDFVAARGAAEEKAIAQLARSTGTYWLTASNSEQFATEFAELGHGLFTYCILLGLQGQADGGDKDKKITVKELSSFLDDKVPELSEKHKGTPQYPNTYGRGMDFPIIIIK